MIVTTIKDEGPSILEWVAHHKRIGFDDIIIYQNNSTDMMPRTLKLMERMGLIRYFDNTKPPGRGGWQQTAFTRAAKLPEYAAADWVLAIDADEYLSINTPEGTVQSLIKAVPETDIIRLNWKIFGSGWHRELSPEMITARYTRAEPRERIAETIVGYKSLYRREVFARPGVHNPTRPTQETWTEVNGSGLPLSEYHNAGWRSTDPGLRKLAQVNHYMVRSAADYLLKCVRGRPNHSARSIRLRYWRNADMNGQEDHGLAAHAPDLWEHMEALNEQSGGKLMRYRARSYQLHRRKVHAALKTDEWRTLYDSLLAISASKGGPPPSDPSPSA